MIPLRVAMLTENDWRHDSRVVREAQAVRSAGHEVTVVCRGAKAGTEEVDGVTFITLEERRRFPLRALPRPLAMHLRVLLADAAGVRRGPERLRRLLSGVEGVVVAVLAPAAAALGAPLLALAGGGTERGRAYTRLRSLAGRVVQPWVYLNEYAVATGGRLAALQPDVVHAHDLVTLSGGAAVSRATGARLVYDAHELETGTNYRFLNALTRRELRRYERALTPATAAVVTVCDSIADWLAREYLLPRPVVVLNAPDATAEEADGDVREILGLAPGVPLAVYVGSVTIDRGLENCARALAHAPELHLATVGPRNSAVEKTLLEIAGDCGVADRLHLVDPVPPARVTSFIRSATCSVIAIQNVCLSYAFCLPNKLLESVFAGLPVAVSDLPEMKRFVETAGCGVVMDERDPVAIARALVALAEDPERYRLRGDDLRRVTHEFGWPAQRTKLLELYARLDKHAPAEPTRTADATIVVR